MERSFVERKLLDGESISSVEILSDLVDLAGDGSSLKNVMSSMVDLTSKGNDSVMTTEGVAEVPLEMIVGSCRFDCLINEFISVSSNIRISYGILRLV